MTLWVGDDAGLSERVSSVMMRFDDFCRQWFHEVTPATRPPTTSAPGLARRRACARRHELGARRRDRRLVPRHSRGARGGRAPQRYLRTPFPEELNRRLITRITWLHLAPTNDEPGEPARRTYRPGGHRDRQHRHRRPARPGSTCRSSDPAVRDRTRASADPAGHGAPARELGRRHARDRRASPGSPRPPDVRSSCRCTRTRACSGPSGRCWKAEQRPAQRAAGLRRVRAAAGRASSWSPTRAASRRRRRRSASPCSSLRETTERLEAVDAGTVLLIGTDEDGLWPRWTACCTTRPTSPPWRTP